MDPYPGWHCIELLPVPAGWRVRCLPHGDLGDHPTHLEAFTAAVQHDQQNGTISMPIVAAYRMKCSECGYLRLADEPTPQEAAAVAALRGWTLYPILCPVCTGIRKGRTR